MKLQVPFLKFSTLKDFARDVAEVCPVRSAGRLVPDLAPCSVGWAGTTHAQFWNLVQVDVIMLNFTRFCL